MKSNEQSTNLSVETGSTPMSPWTHPLPSAANWDAWIAELLTQLEHSQHAQQLVFLGEQEGLSDDQLKNLLTTGGQVLAFEASVPLRDFLRPLHELAIQFQDGGMSSEEFYEQAMPRLHLWTESVLPTLEYITGFGPEAIGRLQHLRECLEQFRDHLFSDDWGRVIGGLVCYLRFVSYDLAFPGSWSLDAESKWNVELSRLLDPISQQNRYHGGELIVIVHPIVAEHGQDWAMEVGNIYQFVRPLPQLISRWRRVVAASMDFENGESCLGADFKVLQRSIQNLLPLVGEVKQSQCRTLLNNAEISVFGTGIRDRRFDASDPQHLRVLANCRDLLRMSADAVCLTTDPQNF